MRAIPTITVRDKRDDVTTHKAYVLGSAVSSDILSKPVVPAPRMTSDELYAQAASAFAPALERLAHAYEANPDTRRDLLQEIHIALWRSFAGFDQRCSLRTWVYRVAHNVGATHITRQRRGRAQELVALEEVEAYPDPVSGQAVADRSVALERLFALIQRLKPLDRDVILSYLEGLDASAMAEITGLSPGNIATKIHRIKTVLTRMFHQGGQSHE